VSSRVSPIYTDIHFPCVLYFVGTHVCLERHRRFEHARFVLLQYKKCKSINTDGTVDIPIAVESLYGFIFAKLHAKYAGSWTPRVDIDPDAEVEVEALRSMAVSSVLTKRFKRGTELSENSLKSWCVLKTVT
jgi:hypothetical protein